MNNMDNETQEAFALLTTIEPTAADAPRPAQLALAQLKQRMAQEEEKRSWHYRLSHYFAQPQRRYGFTAVTATILLIFAFSFPGVRSAAAEFLSLFRVQNFAAITISPEQIALLQTIAEQGLMPGQIEIFEEPGQLSRVNSIAEAAAQTDIGQVRTLPHLGAAEAVYLSSGGNGRLTIDLEGARAILEAVGVNPQLLTDDLAGAQIDVTAFAGIDQQWGEIHLLQSESPQVSYPDSLDTQMLGLALLQVLGLSETEALRLSASIDWTSTLLLPIPQDMAAYNEVTVDGVSGIAVSSLDGRSATILWQKEGTIYTLYADRNVAELLELANTLE